MITIKNIRKTIYPTIQFSRDEKIEAVKHNLKDYVLNNCFTGYPTGYKPLKHKVNQRKVKGRILNDFSDNNLLKHSGNGAQRELAKLIISLPNDDKVKFIGYNNSYCILYKTKIGDTVNYHYRFKGMKRKENLPIDYYYIKIDGSGSYQSISPRNLVRFITNTIKYQ